MVDHAALILDKNACVFVNVGHAEINGHVLFPCDALGNGIADLSVGGDGNVTMLAALPKDICRRAFARDLRILGYLIDKVMHVQHVSAGEHTLNICLSVLVNNASVGDW